MVIEMYLLDRVKKIIDSQDIGKIPITYRKRLATFEALLNGNCAIERDVDCPFYLNDLGVREMNSPSLMYQLIIKRKYFEPFNLEKVEKDLQTIDLEKLADAMDGAFLLLGDYGCLFKVINLRYNDILQSRDYDLYIYSATVLSVLKDKRALDLFKVATRCPNESLFFQKMAYFRLAVAALKRFGRIDLTENSLTDTLNNSDGLTQLDRAILALLLDNFYGLYDLYNADDSHATNLGIKLSNYNALLLCDIILKDKDVPADRFDMVARYRNQIIINKAQLLLADQKIDDAKKLLINNLDETERLCPNYMAEILACLAYVCYLGEDYDQSMSYVKKAIQQFEVIGELVAMMETKKILMACYYSLGDIKSAQGVFKSLQESTSYRISKGFDMTYYKEIKS